MTAHLRNLRHLRLRPPLAELKLRDYEAPGYAVRVLLDVQRRPMISV
jgi:hypothetical protein